ncbi:efflux RND transporter periplasmic adaptor subunit [Larkinella soli]|uniref:efflux RND transporter periplasmic adaptor subunit n=1 Tax=Larkinella soli TaxID=1770527 RepID=UPI000FFBAEB8|nr:efflux RND transporter periplasmic adaptor subunit [Larkinella soli]
MKRKSNRIWWILGGVVILLIVGLVAAKQTGLIGKAKPTEVDFATVKKVDIIERVSASGRVQPEVEVKISPDVSGEIIALYVAEGDSVRQGQLLLKIRPDNYESLLARARATVNSSRAQYEQTKALAAQAQARLLRAKANYERNRKLLADKVISSADFEQIEADYNVARQDVESSQANIKAAEFNVAGAQAGLRDASENLRKTTIYAPVSGTVSKLNVELGERVVGTSQMAGTEMLRIANLNNMEVRVNVNENDIVRVSLGDTADIDVDSYSTTGRKFKGIVTEIANTANGLTGSGSSAASSGLSTDAVTEFEVRIKVLNSSYRDLMAQRSKRSYPLKPGMTASVEVITDRRSGVLAIPIAAVTTRGAAQEAMNRNPNDNNDNNEPNPPPATAKKEEVKEIVFIHQNGKAVQREVKTGISDFDNIEIKSGLKVGEQVVSGPFIAVSKRLKDGDPLAKRDPNKDKKPEKGGEE